MYAVYTVHHVQPRARRTEWRRKGGRLEGAPLLVRYSEDVVHGTRSL